LKAVMCLTGQINDGRPVAIANVSRFCSAKITWT
jgi:hypothetical protein